MPALEHASFLTCMAGIALATTLACSTPPQAEDPSVAGSTSARPIEPAPSASVIGEPSYDVHEWGLVRADQSGDKVRIGAVAPPIPPEVFIITKPVLYFRPDAPMKLRHVGVFAPGGSVVETWPLAVKGPGGELGWSDVSIDPLSACPFSPLPRKKDPPCSELPAGEECESLGLASVRTVDSACVRVGDKTESFLFYRVSTTSLTPPLRFASQKNGDILVKNDGDEKIPGFLIRIDMLQSETKTLTVRPPPPHGSLVVGHEFPPAKADKPNDDSDDPGPGLPRPRKVSGPAREHIRSTMREIGLADTEVDAFMKAWDETLFGSPTRGGHRPVAVGTTLLYFLPPSTLERSAKVTFDPPPRSFKRAFAVWTHLSLMGEAR